MIEANGTGAAWATHGLQTSESHNHADNGDASKLIERAFLGGLIRHPESIPEVRDIIPEDLYWDWHRRVLRAIYRLVDRNVVVELMSVAAEVRSDPGLADEEEARGLEDLVAELSGEAPTGSTVRYFADLIIQRRALRRLDEIGINLLVEASSPSGPVTDIIDQIREQLSGLTGRLLKPADNPLIVGALDNAAFDAAEYKHEELIEQVLFKDEHGVFAAPSKTMKTALIVDAAVSLAAGVPFLERFRVPRAWRVFVMSCESGANSLRARMRQVSRAKGVNPAGLPIYWYTSVEQLATHAGLRNLEGALRHFRAEVVFLDPSYLLLGGDVTFNNAGNMFAMGGLLANVGTACTNAGATCLIATHANGSVPEKKPMELTHIAWSGFQQWARQWWLLSRREKYADDGIHRLFFRYGGSAGHTGIAHLDIDEGTFDPGSGGKKWEVTVTDAREAMRAEAEADAIEEDLKLSGWADLVLEWAERIIAAGNEVATRNRLVEKTTLTRSQVEKAVRYLIAHGRVESATGLVQMGRATRQELGIRPLARKKE